MQAASAAPGRTTRAYRPFTAGARRWDARREYTPKSGLTFTF